MEEIKHVMISVAKSRKSTNWRPKNISLDELFLTIDKPVRTGETYAVYCNANRESQTDIKDVGAFCPWTLSTGHRLKRTAQRSSMLCYDIDDTGGLAPDDVWRMLAEAYPRVAMLMYSTHKHSEKKPRLRVAILTSMALTVDDYEPVARMAAKHAGILDICDPTCFEVARAYFWPSVSRDGDYYSRHQYGEGLRPHEILGLYSADGKNWQNVEAWPMVPGEERKVIAAAMRSRGAGDAQDPTEKPGPIGAFCRAHFPIDKGIDELLGDVYTRMSANRYTYAAGSTAGGLLLYDGKFAYSKHATDPASGLLCNLFDLVRIHRYGHLDEGKRSEGENLPSYKAMLDYVMEDNATKIQMAMDRMTAFEDIDLPTTPCDGRATSENQPEKTAEKATKEDLGWAADLEYNAKSGQILNTSKNVILILENDPRLKGLVRYNEFAARMEKTRPAPWPGKDTWEDADDACLRVYLERNYGIEGREKISDAMAYIFSRNSYHPVRDYLNALEPWDPETETPKAEALFIEWLGAEDTKLNRAMTRKFLAACVARIIRPGCKFDYCLTLMGPEGIGKSTLLKELASEAWFTDSIASFDGKEYSEQIQGVWICEIGEMSAMAKTDQTRCKQVISSQVDKFRPAYGKRVTERPRQCVFTATTNEETPLRGDNGNRRFWLLPVSVMTRPIEEFRQVRDRIWAEALYIYNKGEKLYLDKTLEKQARERQREMNVNVEDPTEGMLRDFLEMELPADWATRDLWYRRRYAMGQESHELATEKRIVFCPCEFICERLGWDLNHPQYLTTAKKVCNIMGTIPGWVSCGENKIGTKIYGRQRGWTRV